MQLRIEEISCLVESAKIVKDYGICNSGNPTAIRELVAAMSDYQIGRCFRAIDQMCFNANAIGSQTVEVRTAYERDKAFNG